MEEPSLKCTDILLSGILRAMLPTLLVATCETFR